MSDIFLSYAAADRERMKPLVNALIQQNWSVWWDREISVGKNWSQVITDALGSAKCVIVVWSSHSVASQWVSNEAGEGMRRRILLPVLIDNVPIPLGFMHMQAANLIGWRGDLNNSEFRQLCHGIRTLTHRQESRAAAVGGGTPIQNPIKQYIYSPPPIANNYEVSRGIQQPQSTSITTDHVASTLCYLLGPLGLILLAFRTYSRNRVVRFHAFQSFFFFVVWLVTWQVQLYLPLIGFFAWLFVMIATLMGRTIKIPLIDKAAEKLA